MRIMQKKNTIQYLFDQTSGIELILCINSAISYPLHNHVSVHTIGVVLCGSIVLTVGSHSFGYETGTSFVLFPYVPHAIEAQHPYSLLTLCINKKMLNQYSKDDIINIVHHLLAANCAFDLSEIQEIHLFKSLDSLDKAYLPHPVEPWIDSVRRQIECHPEMRISLDEMAKALYLSKFQFIRSFKHSVGLTPHQFQIQNRIRKAQHLLIDNRNITEVALATGFCDQSHFIKHFKKYIGLTPTVYKESCSVFKSRSPN